MSPAKDGPRDWDKELAQIDKLIASGKTEPPPLASKPTHVREAPPAPAEAGAGRIAGWRHTPFFTWVRLLLALGLGLGMTQWPYTHGCGLPLDAYLAGVGTVIVASFWTMMSSWKSRSGIAHFLSVALLMWGTALAAREILPRIGYARQSASWICRAAPVQVSPAPAPQAPAPTTP
ncbi:MAG: hypothetical protein ACHQU8_00310 [Gemmatimonadales bacterium]